MSGKPEVKLQVSEAEAREPRYKPLQSGVVELNRIVFIGEGKELEAVVKRIRVGRVRDFIPIEEIEDSDIRAYYEERADRPAYCIEFEIPELGIRGEDTIIFSTHPNSRYIKLSRRYQEIKVGDTVKVVNEAGKLKIV